MTETRTPCSRERDFMFYVILVVIAVVLVGALYFMRGRTSSS
jgi:disulfide bond formation protein DsbB